MKAHKVGKRVRWQWMGGWIDGRVIEVHFNSIVRELKGKQIKRNGSRENPTYGVQSEAGGVALKLHTELNAETDRAAKKRLKSQPKLNLDLLKDELE